jgi:hypothetical protein
MQESASDVQSINLCVRNIMPLFMKDFVKQAII